MNTKVLQSAIIRLSSNGIPLPYEERKIAFYNSLPANLHKAIDEFEKVKDLIAKQGKAVKDTLSPSEKAIDTLLTKRVVEHFLNVRVELNLHQPPVSEPVAVLRPVPVVTAPSSLSLKAKAMSMQLQLLELDGFLGLGYLGKLMVQKFSTIQEIDRKQIDVRPDWFQGRQTAYSQESFDKIVREGFDKSQEPIAVWLDPETKTYIVISGHSRWHASEELFRRGQKDLKTMPVKIFQGSKEEAQDYAILESNRSGTAEGLLSDLKAYKRAVTKGYSKEQLKDLFKPEAHLRLLQDLSYLKETGKFIENLASDAAKSFPYFQRNAQWVGSLE
jgi:hypothetical protein